MTYCFIDELISALNNNRSIRVPVQNQFEGQTIADMLDERSYLDLDFTVYQNVSGQWLLWAAFII